MGLCAPAVCGWQLQSAAASKHAGYHPSSVALRFATFVLGGVLIVADLLQTPTKSNGVLSAGQRAICMHMQSCAKVQLVGALTSHSAGNDKTWKSVQGEYKKLKLKSGNRPVYLRSGEGFEAPKFLYYAQGQWLVGNSVGDQKGWIYVADRGTIPECIRFVDLIQ